MNGCQRAGCHDESVDQHHHVAFGSAEHGSDSRHHFVAAEIGNDGTEIMRLMGKLFETFNRFLQNLQLMADAVVVQPCPRSDTFREWYLPKQVHPDTRWRCVGNAHLSDGDDVAALSPTIVCQRGTYSKGPIQFLCSHGRFVTEITCTPANLAADDALDAAEVVVNADIDDTELETVLSAEHVDAASTVGKVDHLLPCYAAWRNADSFLLNAVIAAQQQVAGVTQLGT